MSNLEIEPSPGEFDEQYSKNNIYRQFMADSLSDNVVVPINETEGSYFVNHHPVVDNQLPLATEIDGIKYKLYVFL